MKKNKFNKNNKFLVLIGLFVLISIIFITFNLRNNNRSNVSNQNENINNLSTFSDASNGLSFQYPREYKSELQTGGIIDADYSMSFWENDKPYFFFYIINNSKCKPKTGTIPYPLTDEASIEVEENIDISGNTAYFIKGTTKASNFKWACFEKNGNTYEFDSQVFKSRPELWNKASLIFDNVVSTFQI